MGKDKKVHYGAGGHSHARPSFIDGQDMPVRFKLHFDEVPDNEEWGVEGARAMVNARNRLRSAIAVLNTPGNWASKDVKLYAHRYFLIDDLTEDVACREIKRVLELTWNGLSAEDIRIDFKRDSTSWGSTERRRPRPDVQNPESVESMEFGGLAVYGTIQVAQKLIEERETMGLAAVTIIHEATHKFAGTWDYCYFDAGGVEPRQPSKKRKQHEFSRLDQDPARHLFRNREKALQNADSFAWFAYNVGSP